MKKEILALFYLILSVNLIGQDKYEGEFAKDQFFLKSQKKIPLDNHIGYDADEGLTLSINYGKNAAIENIVALINSDTICTQAIQSPITAVKWVEIIKGLWINSIGDEERFVDSFNKSEKIKMHYAGFLETGESFDNSFIRNEPLKGKLEWFISGFSIGAVNVMPNTVRIIKISPDLAYGAKGGGNIPPNATLYYVIYNLENPRV